MWPTAKVYCRVCREDTEHDVIWDEDGEPVPLPNSSHLEERLPPRHGGHGGAGRSDWGERPVLVTRRPASVTKRLWPRLKDRSGYAGSRSP